MNKTDRVISVLMFLCSLLPFVKLQRATLPILFLIFALIYLNSKQKQDEPI